MDDCVIYVTLAEFLFGYSSILIGTMRMRMGPSMM